MLTLQMTMFHNGKEDVDSDRKLVKERVIEVPVPAPNEDGQSITLDDCLVSYFDNQVIVERYVQQRRNTAHSLRSFASDDRKVPFDDVQSIDESAPSTPMATVAQDAPYATSPSRLQTSLIRKPSLFSKVLDPEKRDLSAELNSTAHTGTYSSGNGFYISILAALQNKVTDFPKYMSYSPALMLRPNG